MELTCFDKTFEKPMNGIILSFYWNSSFFNKKNTIQLSNPVKPCFLFFCFIKLYFDGPKGW